MALLDEAETVEILDDSHPLAKISKRQKHHLNSDISSRETGQLEPIEASLVASVANIAGAGGTNPSTALDEGLQGFKRSRLYSLAQLKEIAKRPELVEWCDAHAKEPLLLVSIKCRPGIVQVPKHWQNKLEYFSGRSMRRQTYRLPDYIYHTGIAQQRDVFAKDTDTLQQKMRERVQPKLGQLDLDYGKAHAAFFKFQKRPDLTGFGQVAGGTGSNIQMLKYLPGHLSPQLREALELVPGAPPPWSAAMQKLGPPPSYPELKVFNEKQSKSVSKVLWGTMTSEPDIYGEEASSDNENDSDDEDEDASDEERRVAFTPVNNAQDSLKAPAELLGDHHKRQTSHFQVSGSPDAQLLPKINDSGLAGAHENLEPLHKSDKDMEEPEYASESESEEEPSKAAKVVPSLRTLGRNRQN